MRVSGWVAFLEGQTYTKFPFSPIFAQKTSQKGAWIGIFKLITRRKQQKSFRYDHCDLNLCTPLQGNSLWKFEKHSPLHCIYGFAYGLLSHWSHRSSHQYCMLSCLNVSLQITENCLYANTKKTEKSQWKQQVRQLDSLSKLCRDIDNMSCA